MAWGTQAYAHYLPLYYFYGLAADRQEYCFTKDFIFYFLFFFKVSNVPFVGGHLQNVTFKAEQSYPL